MAPDDALASTSTPGCQLTCAWREGSSAVGMVARGSSSSGSSARSIPGESVEFDTTGNDWTGASTEIPGRSGVMSV